MCHHVCGNRHLASDLNGEPVSAAPPEAEWFRRVLCHVQSDGLARIVRHRGSALRLDGVSERVWDLCDRATTQARVVDVLCAEYAVDRATCTADVAALIADLHGVSLLESCAKPNSARDRYLGLIKRALTGLTSVENELRLELMTRHPERMRDAEYVRDIRYREADMRERLERAKRLGELLDGWPMINAHSFIGFHGLDHVERLAETVFADGIAGDFVDAGTWRGGSAIFMRALHEAFDQKHRQLWVADCFAGVPPPVSAPDVAAGLDLTAERLPFMLASQQEVTENFMAFDLLDGGVRFLPGLFEDTLPDAPIGEIALLRMDGDLYTSTLDVLHALYDRIVPGGYVIVDDYALAPCRQAVDEFRSEHGITAPIERINWTIMHWRKA